MKKLSYIILFVLIAAAVFFTASCGSREKAKTEEAAPKTVTEPVFPPVTDGALSGCLFIGDSRTEGLRKAGALPGADTLCAERMPVYNAVCEAVFFDEYCYDLEQLLTERDYAKVYVMLGMDEIEYEPEEIADVYADLIEFVRELEPNAKIIVQANIHFTTERSFHGDNCNNVRMDALNEEICALTDGVTVFWLDPNQYLDDDTGGLRADWAEEDGIHLNSTGYEAWGEWILEQNENY